MGIQGEKTPKSQLGHQAGVQWLLSGWQRADLAQGLQAWC